MNRKTAHQDSTAEQILAEWDASLHPALLGKLSTLAARRGFLTGVIRSAALVGSLPAWGLLQGCDRQQADESWLQQAPWQTLAVVQQQLFPADGNGPSAKELRAIHYLHFVFAAPDTDEQDKDFILNGVKWLDELTQSKYTRRFVALSEVEQLAALQQIATSNAGERWLSNLLHYILEALLTAPVYGGNPDGIGWRWLEHQPGFPLPPLGKRYTELL